MLTAKRRKDMPEKKTVLTWGVKAQLDFEGKKKYRRASQMTSKILGAEFPATVAKTVASLQHHTSLAATKSAGPAVDCIFVAITLSQPLPTQNSGPVQLQLRSPVYSLRDEDRVCLILEKLAEDSNTKERIRKTFAGRIRVIDGEIFKDTMKSKQKLSNFVSGYDLFFCDAKYYAQMTMPVREFLGRKGKCPFPLSGEETDLEQKLAEAMLHTYLTIRGSGRFEYKAARTSEKSAAGNVVDSVLQAIPHILLAAAGKRTTIETIMIKTPDSIELPIYKRPYEENAAA